MGSALSSSVSDEGPLGHQGRGTSECDSLSEKELADRAGRTVVVGLGNEIAGDDAVGVLAARRLFHLLGRHPAVDVVELPWAGLALLDALRGYRRAVLLDSLRSGRHQPGTVVRLSEEDFAGSVRLNSFHDLNYPTALSFGRALGWSMPNTIDVFAVEGSSFDRFETRLTPEVARGLDDVVSLVVSHLAGDAIPGHCENSEVTHACRG